jgi:hypothetical protein
MRRPLGYLLAWLTATAVAVGGSWVGLQSLLDAAAAERPPSLSAERLREAAGPGPSPTASPSASPAASPTAPPSPTAAPTAAPEVTGVSPSPAPDSGWRQVGDGRALERTFVVKGGEVVFRASRVRVDVTSHTANPGYEVSVYQWAPNSVVVSLESPQHTSRVWVMWRDGPYAEITETA